MGEVASLNDDWLEWDGEKPWYSMAGEAGIWRHDEYLINPASGSCDSVTVWDGTDTTSNYVNGTYYYQWTDWWPTLQKVRLKMSEVETLRRAAKKDRALKKVLEKIGPHIEVEVDFG